MANHISSLSLDFVKKSLALPSPKGYECKFKVSSCCLHKYIHDTCALKLMAENPISCGGCHRAVLQAV
eukprot:6704221-Ditylum_brightwellii.AAC.1